MTDIDDYSEPEGEPQEEPGCYSCNDSGCPDCGYVNPQDPKHQRYLAAQIIQARVPKAIYTATATDHELGLAIAGVPDVHLSSLTAVGDLVTSAIVTVSVTWPDPNAVQPF